MTDIALDPIRVLINKAPEIEKTTEQIEEAISTLYQAVYNLKQFWRTIVVNGKAAAITQGQTITIDQLPTWQQIHDLLVRWHALTEEYHRIWDQLPETDKERLPNLEPGSLVGGSS
jgi:hypothetical protein